MGRAMLRDRQGQGLVEYVLILVFAVVVVVSAVAVFGRRTDEMLTNTSGSVGNVLPP